MKSQESRLVELLDKAEIREVLIRWNRALDRGDVELLKSCYHPDAVDVHGIHTYVGDEEASREYVSRHMQGPKRHFHVTMQETIEISGDVAACENYWISYLMFSRESLVSTDASTRAEDGAASRPHSKEILLIAGGRYLDRFEKRASSWKIAHRKMIVEWKEAYQDSIELDSEMPKSPFRFSRVKYDGDRSRADPSYLFFDAIIKAKPKN